MFDFIKRMFGSKKQHCSHQRDVAAMDVVEGNDIEILKTSEFSEGTAADAIEKLVAEQELPPPELDLPMAELDEPSNEPDMPAEEEQPDNYMLGELKKAWKERDKQTRKAGMQYWNDGLMKYRPRSERAAIEGTNAKQFNYFEVLRDEPMLRQVELQHPGMNIEQLNLNRFMQNSLKGKMVSEYVLRSTQLIRKQEESGITPVWSDQQSTNGGSDLSSAHGKTLRDMFNALEAEQRPSASAAVDVETADSEGGDEEVEELLQHFDDLFHQEKSDENDESYTRWLLSVAEDGTASTDILWLLAEDPNPDVRFCLAENYNIDQDILKLLSEDENPYVAHRAQKTLMRLNSTARQVMGHNFGRTDDVNRFRKSG